MFRKYTGAATLLRVIVPTCAVSLQAQAHHIVSEYGLAPSEPLRQIVLDTQYARFNLPEGKGWYWSTAALLEYAPVAWISGQVRVPLHRLHLDGRPAAVGLGDIEWALKVRVYATEHGELIVSGGLGSELPTGNDEAGIGSGHVELIPFMTASTSHRDFAAFALLADRLSLGDHSAGEHFNFISPHTHHELAYRLGGGYVFGPAYASLAVDGVTVLASEDRGATLLSARGEIGWRPVKSVTIAAAADLPVTRRHRFDVRGRLSTTVRF